MTRHDRMTNARYWTAEVRGWFENGPNAGIDGRYHVELLAGTPTIVLDETWNDETVQAVIDGLRDYGFPPQIRVRELADETRLFMTPTDDRLVSSLADARHRADLG